MREACPRLPGPFLGSFVISSLLPLTSSLGGLVPFKFKPIWYRYPVPGNHYWYAEGTVFGTFWCVSVVIEVILLKKLVKTSELLLLWLGVNKLNQCNEGTS